MAIFKRLLLACLLLAVISVFMVLPVSAQEQFNFTGYDIDMVVNNDNTYQITETIDVNFTSMFMHGIFRAIPDKTYNNYPVNVKSIRVEGAKYNVSHSGGYYNIRIGDANNYANATERYVITYKFEIGEDNIQEYDEIAFNLIGTQWNTNISGVSFKVTMPYDFDKSRLNFTYGKYGSTSTSDIKYDVRGTVIQGTLNKKLGPYEGLTMALTLPQGYFDKAVKIKTLADRLREFYPLIFAGLLALALLVWYSWGKNKKLIPVVEFNPPDGMTSADIGYIYDSVVNSYDITSLIIYWAGKGCLAIEEFEDKGLLSSKKDYSFTKLKELPAGSKNYEKIMFRDLFDDYGDGKTVNMEQLRNNFYKTVNTVKSLIKDQYSYNRDVRVFEHTGPIAAFLLQIIGYVTAFITVYGVFYKPEFGSFTDVFIIAALIAFLLFAPLNLISHAIFKWPDLSGGKKAGFVIASSLLIFIFYVVLSMFVWRIDTEIYALVGTAVSFLSLHMSRYCIKRTSLGNEYQSRLLGFRDFMLNAEMDRIKALADESPQYFYKALPFAIAFGIAEKWAAKFDGITTEPPDWYRTSGQPGLFNTILFTNMLTGSMHNVSAAMTSMPSQSSGGFGGGGSFGGGFSGGGSGGGGGGGW